MNGRCAGGETRLLTVQDEQTFFWGLLLEL